MNLTTFFLLFGLCGLQLTGLGQSYFRVGLEAGPKLSFSDGQFHKPFINQFTPYLISDWSGRIGAFVEWQMANNHISLQLGYTQTPYSTKFIFKNNPSYPPIKFPNESFVYDAWELPLLFKVAFIHSWKNRLGANLLLGLRYVRGKAKSIYFNSGYTGVINTDITGTFRPFTFQVEGFSPTYPTEKLMVQVGLECYAQLAPLLRLFLVASYQSAAGDLMNIQIDYDDGFNEPGKFQLRAKGESLDFSLGLAVTIGGSKAK
ncbi:MAG: hypothetical protein D6730_02905 [Bacteroidetes bacterium]|nr:MAG: hypothetical protein D6730_02905 [Bacteroidota bacterium]